MWKRKTQQGGLLDGVVNVVHHSGYCHMNMMTLFIKLEYICDLRYSD